MKRARNTSISRVKSAAIGALLPHLEPPVTQDQILTRHRDKTALDFTTRYKQTTQRCDAFAAKVCRHSKSRRACKKRRRAQCYEEFRPKEADRPPHPALYEIHVQLQAIKELSLRKRLGQIPTTLELSRDDVDVLIRSAAILLDQSDGYQRLLRDLGGVQTSH